MFKANDKIVNKFINDKNETKQLNEEILFGLFIIGLIIYTFL